MHIYMRLLRNNLALKCGHLANLGTKFTWISTVQRGKYEYNRKKYFLINHLTSFEHINLMYLFFPPKQIYSAFSITQKNKMEKFYFNFTFIPSSDEKYCLEIVVKQQEVHGPWRSA